jgi:hypothetical protein
MKSILVGLVEIIYPTYHISYCTLVMYLNKVKTWFLVVIVIKLSTPYHEYLLNFSI